MNQPLTDPLIPTLQPPAPRLKVVRAGQAWHVRLPGTGPELTCVEIDEVTPATVILRFEPDPGQPIGTKSPVKRFLRSEVEFHERVPE